MRMRSVATGVAIGIWLAGPAGAQTGVFRSAFTETGLSNATGIAVGDFDGDSKVDVVTANAGIGGNELAIFFGFGDGTVSRTGQTIELNGVPAGMIQGKFDGDQLDDLIVANGTDSSISFLKGLGNQDYFAPPGDQISVGHSPTGFAAVDLTGDSRLDLVVANEGGDSTPGSVSILRGQGDGTFVLLQQADPDEPGMTVDALPAGLGTRAVAVGNVDGSAGLDIVAANSRDDTVAIFTGQGNGFFAPLRTIEVGAAPQDLALTDVNGDGRLDLILAAGNADQVEVRLGDAQGQFTQLATYPVGTAPNRLALAQLNNDGRLDIVTTNTRSGDASVLLANGTEGFLPARSYVADGEPQVLAVADLNADGIVDVISSNQGSDEGPSVAVLRNRGGGLLQGVEDLPIGTGPAAVATADFDDDAQPDLVVTGETGQLGILFAGASGLVIPAQGVTVGGRSIGVVARDLNGDALPDLAVVDGDANNVVVLRNLGSRQFAAPATFATSPNPGVITSGDFNADGRPDLAVSALGTERTCRGGSNAGQTCLQDIDCGGGVCTAPGFAVVLLQQSDGRFGPARAIGVEETPIGIAAADDDCDGRDDLLVANEASNTVTVLRSVGDGTFTTAQTVPPSQAGQGPIALAVGDFNKDGIDDFALSNFVTPAGQPSLRIFSGVCDGPFQPVTGAGGQLQAGNQVVSIVARDFTGDGNVDIALVNQTINAVGLLTGQGNGRFSLGRKDGVSRMPISIAAADFDSDGRYDTATANSDASANNVSILSNCARDVGCDPFARPGPPQPPGEAALRGDANNDGMRSAADLVAVAAEVADGDGDRVEDIPQGDFAQDRVSAGVDANGDGRVDPQDRSAAVRRLFSGA